MSQSEEVVKSEHTNQSLCFEDIKNGKFNDFPKIKSRGKRSYAWTSEENYLYMSYLKMFSRQLQIPIMGKFLKFFTRMARFITTRSSHQIKSHHQKMVIKHGDIQTIIKYVEVSLSFELYESVELFQKIKDLDSIASRFLSAEKEAITQLLYIYRVRMEKEGTFNRQVQKKLLSIIPSMPRFDEVKIQEENTCYKYFESLQLLQNYQEEEMCKSEFD